MCQERTFQKVVSDCINKWVHKTWDLQANSTVVAVLEVWHPPLPPSSSWKPSGEWYPEATFCHGHILRQIHPNCLYLLTNDITVSLKLWQGQLDGHFWAHKEQVQNPRKSVVLLSISNPKHRADTPYSSRAVSCPPPLGHCPARWWTGGTCQVPQACKMLLWGWRWGKGDCPGKPTINRQLPTELSRVVEMFPFSFGVAITGCMKSHSVKPNTLDVCVLFYVK